MPDDHLILELARLALAGDSDGARRLVGKVLQNNSSSENSASLALRESLAKLLVGAKATSRAVRYSRQAVADSGGNSLPPTSEASPLTRVEQLGDAPCPVLSSRAARLLDGVVAERRHADVLHDRGVEPTRSLLLTGAPGVGKTMSVRFLAASLHLPLVTVDLASIMSSYLGQTGQNLRRALDIARASSCVFFIDEVDAVAKRRNDDTDVGELKRLVNILLLEIERWPAHSVLVAATNHPELLDRAIWRRFDCVLHLSKPTFKQRRQILGEAVVARDHKIAHDHLTHCAAATEGLTGSDLVQLAVSTIRTALVAGNGDIGPLMVERAMELLAHRSRYDERARLIFCELAARELSLSQREIARLVGLSHVQVGRLIKQAQRSRGNGQVASA